MSEPVHSKSAGIRFITSLVRRHRGIAQGARPVEAAIANESGAIGCIGLRLSADVHRRTAELGDWLGEPFWNRGVMTEAVSAFTSEAFHRFGLVRIFTEPFASNAGSIRVPEKAAFPCEGRLRAHVLKDGTCSMRWFTRNFETIAHRTVNATSWNAPRASAASFFGRTIRLRLG